MPLNSIHTAVHTIFGATISVALGLSLNLTKLNELFSPVGIFVILVLVAVKAEVLHYQISAKRPCTLISCLILGTLIFFAGATAATFSTSEDFIKVVPDTKFLFLTILLGIWVLCLAVLGFVKRMTET